MTKTKCSYCNVEYVIHTAELKRYIKHYCSKTCQNKGQIKEVSTIVCLYCKNNFLPKEPHKKRKFCSHSCSAKYNNKSIRNNTRSNFEKFIELQIKEFTNLKFECNNRSILNGLELDFYFPEINCAIELNGPIHYLPIYGEETLQKRQRIDIEKIAMCKKLNLTLFIIDISKYKYLTKNHKTTLWNIINDFLSKYGGGNGELPPVS